MQNSPVASLFRRASTASSFDSAYAPLESAESYGTNEGVGKLNFSSANLAATRLSAPDSLEKDSSKPRAGECSSITVGDDICPVNP